VRVAVVDHGMGNLRSVAKALEAAGATVSVETEPNAASRADGLCVPGQGIFGRCMTNLTALGFDDRIRQWVDDGKPLLGICLGYQILFDRSDESPEPGLGIVAGEVRRLPETVTVPHIGWNTVGDRYFYFDHSYAPFPEDETCVAGWCDHGQRFAARLDDGALTGVQFHPEKSGAAGIALLKEWVER